MQPSRQTLQKIVLDALHRTPKENTPVLAWALVCGSPVATKTQALSFEKGTLRILVPDATWRAQLRDMAGEFLAALNKISLVPVDRIEFVLTEGQRINPQTSKP